MAAVRGVPKSTAGGRGDGPEPPSVERFIVCGRVRPQPANDNAPIHGGREALCFAAGIVLTVSGVGLGAPSVVVSIWGFFVTGPLRADPIMKRAPDRCSGRARGRTNAPPLAFARARRVR